MHTLAGLLHVDGPRPALDYEGYLRAAWMLTRGTLAVREAFRRMVFNVLAHNRDDHPRNVSFVMEGEGTWRLAPAYGLGFSRGPDGGHVLAVAGEAMAPSYRHLSAVAARMSIALSEASKIVEEVDAAVGMWPRFAADAGVTPEHAREIGDALREVRRTFRPAVVPVTGVRRTRRRRSPL